MDYRGINDAASMADVLAAYGIQTDTRRNVAVCPFHDDTRPSMHVYPHSFYCFACGAGGDVIKFVQKMDGVSAHDAAEKVLAICGGESVQMDYRARRRIDEQKKAERQRELKFDRKCDTIGKLHQCEVRMQEAEPFSVEWCDACLEYDRILWEIEEIDRKGI